MVKTPCFHCGGYGPDPTQGTKIPHAMQHGQKLTKKKKKEVKIHFFINMDIHVPVPCIEKIILSLQN